MVHPEVGDTVPNQKVHPAELGADQVQNASDNGETDVTQDNELSILGLVQRARRVEVVDTAEVAVLLALSTTFRLTFVVVVASDVGEQVHGPTEELLEKEVEGSGDGGFLHQLIELVQSLADARGILLPGLGHEHHVAGNVAGGLVVLSVGDLPGEVGHQKSGVADPTNSVIENLGGRESLVTALVSQNPDTGTEQTLHDGVKSPQHDSCRLVRDGLRGHVVVEDIEDGREPEDIPEDIIQAGESFALIAMGGNGITDLLDGIIRDLELVAIGVQHLAAGLCLRRQRGQGSGRRGLARAVQRGGGDRAGNGRIRSIAVQRNALGESCGRHVEACPQECVLELEDGEV